MDRLRTLRSFVRLANTGNDLLVGVCLTDELSDGFSMVYSFSIPLHLWRSVSWARS